MSPRKPPLPFVPGHRYLHHLGWPCHAYGAAAFLRRIPVFLLDRHPDDYLTRLRGERPGDGTESFDARAVFGQQKHPLSRVGNEGRPVLAERHLFTNCIGLEPAERLGDRNLTGQDLERLLIEIRVLRLQSARIRVTPWFASSTSRSQSGKSSPQQTTGKVSKSTSRQDEACGSAVYVVTCFSFTCSPPSV
jgi:hypothetical protein